MCTTMPHFAKINTPAAAPVSAAHTQHHQWGAGSVCQLTNFYLASLDVQHRLVYIQRASQRHEGLKRSSSL